MLAKIKKDLKRILSIILDIQSIYTNYLNQANKTNNIYNEIYIYLFKLEYKLHISNIKRE